MTRQEFLQELRTALSAEADAYTVQDNLNYYENYLREEERKGRREEDVLEELGDPWAIARTILDSPGGRSGRASYEEYEETDDGNESEYRPSHGHYGQSGTHVYTIDTWWKKLLLILGIVLILVAVFSLITGIISLVAPILIPLLVILLVIRLIGGRRRW